MLGLLQESSNPHKISHIMADMSVVERYSATVVGLHTNHGAPDNLLNIGHD